MSDNTQVLVISTLFSLFLVCFMTLLFAFITRQNAKHDVFYKEDDEWIFNNFFEKLYDVVFGNKAPEDIGRKIGIDMEKYARNCAILRVAEKPKHIVMSAVVGIALLLFGIYAAVFTSFIIMVPFILIAYMLVIRPTQKLVTESEYKRNRIADDLTRYLDILATELHIGLPVEQAIMILSEKYECLLSQELLISLKSMEIGAGSWQSALEDVAQRYQIESLSSFVLDIITSYQKGVSVADTVERKAIEVQKLHIVSIKERTGRLSELIFIPAMFFKIVPIFILFIIPIFAQLKGI